MTGLMVLLLFLCCYSAFPDALVPQPNFTTTTCRQVAVPASRQERGARGGAATGITSAVYGADAVGNNYTAQAEKTFPSAAAAVSNVTTRTDPNRQGNYSIFAAALNAAAQALNGNSTTPAGGNNAGSGRAATTGRHLLQANTASTNAANTNNSLTSRQQAALAGTTGTGGVTVLAPTNAAITKYLQQSNLTAQQFLANKTLLLKVLSYHIIPNEALTVADLANATAKRDPNHQLKTLLPYNNVGYKLNKANNATLYGAAGSAAIVDANMRSGNVSI